MDLVLVLKAVGALVIVGSVAATMLAVASRRFAVESDPLVEAVLSSLPGANCGACGRPSCFAAAEAIVAGDALVTACTAGGQQVADAVAAALGVESCAVLPVVSQRRCGGGTNAQRAFAYSGLMSCTSVAKLAGGDRVCPAGCFGYGDCVAACPFDAMTLDARGLPVIDLDLCTGCEICVRECPRGGAGLLAMAPSRGAVAVRCSSHDRPKLRKSYCSMCCIACKKCEKACPVDAIHVLDLLAVVDYDACIGCGRCVEACPQDCIDLTGRDAVAPAASIDGAAGAVPGFAPMSDEQARALSEPRGEGGEPA